MKVKVVKTANAKYVKEGQIIDLPDHIAKAGIKEGVFAAEKAKATKRKK